MTAPASGRIKALEIVARGIAGQHDGAARANLHLEADVAAPPVRRREHFRHVAMLEIRHPGNEGNREPRAVEAGILEGDVDAGIPKHAFERGVASRHHGPGKRRASSRLRDGGIDDEAAFGQRGDLGADAFGIFGREEHMRFDVATEPGRDDPQGVLEIDEATGPSAAAEEG